MKYRFVKESLSDGTVRYFTEGFSGGLWIYVGGTVSRDHTEARDMFDKTKTVVSGTEVLAEHDTI